MTSNDDSRQVTDPVTHLPLDIRDRTALELEQIPSSKKQRQQELDGDAGESYNAKQDEDISHIVDKSTQRFTSRPGEATTDNRRRVHAAFIAVVAFAAGSVSMAGLQTALSFIPTVQIPFFKTITTSFGLAFLTFVVAVSVYKFVPLLFHDRASQKNTNGHVVQKPGHDDNKDQPSTAWVNALLSSLWPIINPTLFVAVVDMLEDQLQATMPPFIHSLRVADLGQGSVPLQILSIRHLTDGHASKDVDGLKAEQGEFVNLELAVAYRGSDESPRKNRSGNAHMLMEFFTVAGLTVPVWVELDGLLLEARVRVQLTSDPPFLALMTGTLLGQPKVSFSCTPMVKRQWLNVMDVPGLSSWLQSAVDEAVKFYVAPRSLDLDLGSLLGVPSHVGDVEAIGAILVRIHSASDFRSGDGAKIWQNKQERNGDIFVTVGWAKWGKKMWATRIIHDEGKPVWGEETVVLVGPAEVNAREKLRVQLWDSDRFTADDLIGSVDMSLSDLIKEDKNKERFNRTEKREDHFMDVSTGKNMPGVLNWEVGYYAKTGLLECLGGDESRVKEIRERVDEQAEHKLREARTTEAGVETQMEEVDQLKEDDFQKKVDEMIAGNRPSDEWPSGILAVRIEEITGLELVNTKQGGPDGDIEGEGVGEGETGKGTPSAYCEIVVNQERWYKTRTKVRSSTPYFDAGTERFIRDWNTTGVVIVVRDFRLHEANPLLGIVSLPLKDVLRNRSYIYDEFPLVGGMGVGRVRIKLTFRSVSIHLPREMMGWNVGTLKMESRFNLPNDDSLSSHYFVARTSLGKVKLVRSESGVWTPKHPNRPIQIPVQKRFTERIVFEFSKRAGVAHGPTKVGQKVIEVFGVLWLNLVPDSAQQPVQVKLWRGGERELDRAKSCRTEEEIGEDTGMRLQVTLTFQPGMGSGHRKLAKKDAGVADVVEVTECVDSEEGNMDWINSMEGDDDSSSSSSSSSSEEELESNGDKDRFRMLKDEAKGYMDRRGDLHRKHQGIMQWKTARRAAWISQGMEKKAAQLGDKVKSKVTGKKNSDLQDDGLEKEI